MSKSICPRCGAQNSRLRSRCHKCDHWLLAKPGGLSLHGSLVLVALGLAYLVYFVTAEKGTF